MTVHAVPRRRRFLHAIAASLLSAGLLVSCASLIGPRQVEVPLSKLQEGLERRFPLNNRVMSLLDVQLAHPRLALLPESQRVALSVDVSVAPPLTRQSWHGTLTLSGRLVVDLTRNAVFLGDAKVERVAIDGLDEGRQRQFAQAANLVVDKLVKDVSVHNFRPEDLRMAGVQFTPTLIAVTPASLVLTLEPMK
ncbi:MAG TPA: DUF1439 domain-containing protein [Janthinobacterium sp.]|jgi:hypothetical protein|nr:DUF1439 domain-containing protein [Janthinobacterium sp.]